MTARPSGDPRPGMRDGFDRSGDARRDDIRRGNDGFDRSGDARRDDFRRGSDDSDRSGDAQRDDFRRGNDDPDRSGDRQRDDFRRGNLGSDRSGDAQRYDFRRGTNDGRDVYGDRFRARRYDNTPSRIVDRPFIGNSIEFNDRRFNLGSSNYQPSYYRHSSYHGYWNGNRGFGLGPANNYGYGSSYGPGWGWGLGNRYQYDSRNLGFGYRPLGWGLGGWGLGSLIYRSGYLGYSNPYYVGGGTTVYNYSQPIPVTYGTQAEIIQDDPNSPDSVLNDAVAAFQRNDYDAALDIVNKGIAQYPDDAVLHEFRSLVLFARQDYQQSASTIHAVLAVGPGWDWTTLSSMYASVPLYTEHLRALEAFTKANPQDAASRFLLAYHYLTCGHTDAAARQLQQVVTLLPNDRVAADVLKLVAAPLADEPGEIAEAPLSRDARDPTGLSVQSVDPETLVGTWKASREDGSLFKLTLTDDARFTWTFNEKGQAAQTFEGTYSVEGDVLVLERQDGGSLIAAVAPSGDQQFNFKLLGAPEDDPGLSFSR